MGCIPSSNAYPGNRRVAKPSYQPGANEFQQVDSNTAVCTTHFVTCPGGNALKLVGKPNRAEGNSNDGLAKYIQGEYIHSLSLIEFLVCIVLLCSNHFVCLLHSFQSPAAQRNAQHVTHLLVLHFRLEFISCLTKHITLA